MSYVYIPGNFIVPARKLLPASTAADGILGHHADCNRVAAASNRLLCAIRVEHPGIVAHLTKRVAA